MLLTKIVVFLSFIVYNNCNNIGIKTIVYPRIVKRFKRNINSVSDGIQLDIDGQNESERFSLHLKKNTNLVTRSAIIGVYAIQLQTI